METKFILFTFEKTYFRVFFYNNNSIYQNGEEIVFIYSLFMFVLFIELNEKIELRTTIRNT